MSNDAKKKDWDIGTAIDGRCLMPVKLCEKNPGFISQQLKDIFSSMVMTQSYNNVSGADRFQAPILIQAPTGAGKSTFILEELAEIANKHNMRILLLTNRTGLCLQQRIESNRNQGGPEYGTYVYTRKPISANLDIITYQEAISYIKHDWYDTVDKVGIVVCDEAHFFCSDATFNSQTSDILRTIISKFFPKLRIYLTATPDEVERIILAEEQHQVDVWEQERVQEYEKARKELSEKQVEKVKALRQQQQREMEILDKNYEHLVQKIERLEDALIDTNEYELDAEDQDEYDKIQFLAVQEEKNYQTQFQDLIKKHSYEDMLLVQEQCQQWAQLEDSYRIFLQYMAAPKNNWLIKYKFPSNFEHVKLHFFYEWGSIVQAINDEGSIDKWLIFVPEIKDGEELKKKIERPTDFMHSEIKGDDKESFLELIRTQKFKKDVLISTTFLYNGVSFKDKNLKHIVVDFVNKTDVLQMLGRKRCKPNEEVDLYIRVPTKSDMKKYYDLSKKKLDMVRQYKRSPWQFFRDNWNKKGIDEDFLQVFGAPYDYTGTAISMSEYAPYKLGIEVGIYEHFIDRVGNSDSEFEKEVCSWFGKEYSEEMKFDETLIELRSRVSREIQDALKKYIYKSPFPKSEDQKILGIVKKIIGKKAKVLDIDFRGKYEASRFKADMNNLFKKLSIPYYLKLDNTKYILEHKLTVIDMNE